MTTALKIDHHNTDADLYEAPKRVFGEKQHNQTRWVVLSIEAATVNFYAPRGEEVQA